jgi:hypothetical protein
MTLSCEAPDAGACLSALAIKYFVASPPEAKTRSAEELMSKDALKFVDELLRPYDRRSVSATMEDIMKAVAWKTMPNAYCSCGERTLSERAKTSIRTVRRSLDKAENLNLIRRIPRNRGLYGGRGRAHDVILIVGFNDVAWADQADKSSGKSTQRPTGHTDTTIGPKRADQPVIQTRAYKEVIKSTNLQSPLNPSAPTPNQSAMMERAGKLVANMMDSMDAKLQASLMRLDQNVRKRSAS